MTDLSVKQYLIRKGLDPTKGIRHLAPNTPVISVRNLIKTPTPPPPPPPTKQLKTSVIYLSLPPGVVWGGAQYLQGTIVTFGKTLTLVKIRNTMTKTLTPYTLVFPNGYVLTPGSEATPEQLGWPASVRDQVFTATPTGYPYGGAVWVEIQYYEN